MRRYGESRILSQRYTDRPGAYAIIADGRDLLLTAEHGVNFEIQLPGGGIDSGESPVRALHREVYEETGYRITAPRRVGAYQRYCYIPDYDMWARKICHIYLCAPARRVGPPTEPHHDVVWAPARDAVQMLTNVGDAAVLQQVLGRR